MIRRFAIRSLVAAMVALAAWPAGGQEQAPSEYHVKAAFVYNFVKFVEWPATPGTSAGPIALCLLGADPFDGELARAIDGKSLDGRPLTIRRIRDASAAHSCHVLFVSASEGGRAADILKIASAWSVLTVADSEQLWEQGVMINLVMDGKKVRFRINRAAAERAFLKISSKLLQLSVASADK